MCPVEATNHCVILSCEDIQLNHVETSIFDLILDKNKFRKKSYVNMTFLRQMTKKSRSGSKPLSSKGKKA